MKTLVADIGGTRVKAGIMSRNEILCSEIFEAKSGKDFQITIDQLNQVFLGLIKSVSLKKEDIQGIGLTMPGLVDIDKNRVIAINEKYSSSVNFDFNAWAKKEWNIPITMDNDARAALAGAWKFGVGKGFDSLVMITLGTGVGGAAMINGKLIYGKHYQAGCLGGHFTVNYHGNQCNCGNIGCVEAFGSSWALTKYIQPLLSNGTGDLDFKKLFEQYRRNDNESMEVVINILKAWASGTVNLIHAYDPEMVIFSGGVLQSSDIILPFIKKWVDQHAWTPWGEVKIEKATNVDNIALLGMGYLVEQLIKGDR